MFHILFLLLGACSRPEIPVRWVEGPAGPPPPALTPDMRVPAPTPFELPLRQIGDFDGDHVPDLGVGLWTYPKREGNLGDLALLGVAWLDGGPFLQMDWVGRRYTDGLDRSALPLTGPVDVDGDGINDIVSRTYELRGCERECAWDEACELGDTFRFRGPNDPPRDLPGLDHCGPALDTASPCEATCDHSFARFIITFGGRGEVVTLDIPSTVHEHRVLDVDGDGADDLVVRRDRQLAWVPSRGGVFSGPPRAFAEVDALFSDLDRGDREIPHLDLAGDVNGDGYDDLIVADGRIYREDFVVLAGGAQGPSSTPLWRLRDMLPEMYQGAEIVAVYAIGDVNGDGFGDLSLNDSVYREGVANMLVFHGGPAGLSEIQIALDYQNVPIGDFDGDGYDDLLSSRFVYLGSRAGLVAVPWLSLGDNVDGYVGVGDVDGDGKDDVARWDEGANEILVWFGREMGDDRDGDGTPDALDCGPLSWEVHPGATEASGNPFDDDCDGQWLCKLDLDGDLRDGTTEALQPVPCALPEWSRVDDCDDADPTRYRGAMTVADNDVDENCDGLLELSCPRDADNDGYPNPNGLTWVRSVVDECPNALAPLDCDDYDRLRHPGAEEDSPLDGDRNCDGVVLCYVDTDGDGRGGTVVTQTGRCPVTLGYDCDEADPTRHGGVPEVIDNDVDENCDGRYLCTVDADNDGWTTTQVRSQLCSSSPAVTPNPGDCVDSNAQYHPGAVELPGNGDEDCNGLDANYVDLDGDGFGGELVEGPAIRISPYGNDCDDSNRWIGPGLPDAPGDAVDADCDGVDPFHLTAVGRSITVHGLPPRGRWWLAFSRTGAGPCVDVADGMCVELISPTLFGEGQGAPDGARVRIPAGAVGYAQAIARVDGSVWRTTVLPIGAP